MCPGRFVAGEAGNEAGRNFLFKISSIYDKIYGYKALCGERFMPCRKSIRIRLENSLRPTNLSTIMKKPGQMYLSEALGEGI